MGLNIEYASHVLVKHTQQNKYFHEAESRARFAAPVLARLRHSAIGDYQDYFFEKITSKWANAKKASSTNRGGALRAPQTRFCWPLLHVFQFIVFRKHVLIVSYTYSEV